MFDRARAIPGSARRLVFMFEVCYTGVKLVIVIELAPQGPQSGAVSRRQSEDVPVPQNDSTHEGLISQQII